MFGESKGQYVSRKMASWAREYRSDCRADGTFSQHYFDIDSQDHRNDLEDEWEFWERLAW